MQTEVVFAGFGGQGVLFAGQILAYAGMDAGMDVTWMPSYGPEMRGGTANCQVILSNEEIGSPLARNPGAAVVMNLPSLDKFEAMVKPGGVLVVNASLVNRDPRRSDIRWCMIPAQEIAEAIGYRRLQNMVMLGALVEMLQPLGLEKIEQALTDHLPERHRKHLPGNYEALRQGAAYARGEHNLEIAPAGDPAQPAETIPPTAI